MPFIHICAYSGRTMEVKKSAVEAIVKAASEAMNAPETAFTVAFQEVEKEKWDEEVGDPIVKPLSDKVLYKQGKLL